MRIEAIRLRHVRGFGEEGVALEGLGPGLNVLSAPNEFGKSTVFDAVRAALFHKHTTTHREVKSLEPDPGDGAPEIVLDIASGNGRFRIEKRFLRRKMAKVTDLGTGRAVAEADDAERWIRQLIGADKPGHGPTGLLWVEQGASLRQPDGAEGRGDAVYDALGEEVAEVTGGERARRVLSRARERLDVLVTRERRAPKAGGPYKAASDLAAALREEAETLAAKVRASRTTREQLGGAEDELARLNEDGGDELGAQLGAARTRLAEAERAAAGLETARAAASRAVESVRAADAALRRREEDEADAEAAFTEADAAASRLAPLREAFEDAKAAAAEADSAAKQAAEAERGAAETRDRAVAARNARAAGEALERLRRDFGEAQAAKAALSALGEPDPAPDLAGIEAARTALTVAEARAEAVRVRLVVEHSDGATLDGVALAPGERTLSGAARLEARGLSVRIEAPEAAEERAVADARGALSALLRAASVSDAEEARAKAEALREAEAERRRLRDLLSRFAPDGLGALADRIAATERAARGVADAPDEAEAAAALREAASAAAAAAGAADAARTRLDGAREAAGQASERAAVAKARAADARARLGPPEGWEDARGVLRRSMEEAEAERDAAARSLAEAEARVPDREAARAEADRLGQALRNREQRVLHLNREAARLRADLARDRSEGAEERLAAVEGQGEAAAEEAARYAREADALALLIDTLSGAQAERRERFLAPVTAELGPLLAAVFPAGGLSLNEDLSPDALTRDGAAEDVARLSGGTREQLAILTRLGFARLMAKGGHPVPVVLDDALVFADDARIARMFTALNLAARDVQVIALTCRQGAFEGLGGQILTPTPLGAAA